MYNTEKTPIIVREFGRNMQKMILFAKDIENRDERQAAINRIVDLILDMYPTTQRNREDYRIKIWSHVLQICDYELDVDIPSNIPKRKEKIKPDPIPYPSRKLRFRHYGKGIQGLVHKAMEMEDEEKQAAFVEVIGSFMKMSYKLWNRENATNEIIDLELKKLSGGKLSLDRSMNIDKLVNPATKRKKSNRKKSSRTNKSRKHK